MTKKRVAAKWLNTTIWGKGTLYRHIFMLEDFTWLAVDPIDLQAGWATYSFTREHLTSDNALNDKKNWLKIFEAIDNGAPPDWVASDFNCSCGAWATMGKRWVLHSSTCNFKIGPPTVKNNDGRISCLKCGQRTKQAGGGAYSICSNKECVWYDN